VKEEGVAAFSFAFGALPAADVAELHARGTAVIGTATTPGEARELEATGVDAVVAQGAEAGGHRSTFAGPFDAGLVGTMALVPQVVDAVRLPVIAAGGIMDGRGIVAALALGAAGVQMGTAFLGCTESGTHPLHLEALFARRETDTTRLTRSYSGRPARGFANRFMVEVEKAGAILPYPYQNALTSDIRRAAAHEGRSDLMAMWAGQGAPLAVATSARQLVADLVAQAERVAGRLR
jgi:nitronate monooxygenase